MQKIISESDLIDSIAQIEKILEEENSMLKAKIQVSLDSIRPFPIIRNTLRQLAASQEIKENIIKITAGLATVYISNRIFKSNSSHLFKNVLNSGLFYGITNFLTKKSWSTEPNGQYPSEQRRIEPGNHTSGLF